MGVATFQGLARAIYIHRICLEEKHKRLEEKHKRLEENKRLEEKQKKSIKG